MRRQIVAGPAETARTRLANLLAQPLDLAHERVDLLLLADDDLVKLVKQVFVEAGLDFQLGQSVVGVVVDLHTPIGHEAAARRAGLCAPALGMFKIAFYNFSFAQES